MATILLIDDSNFQRNRVAKLITHSGYEVREATNGKQGLEQLTQAPVDLVLLDLLMPELDGFGVLEALREKQITTPVIVLTADIQESQRERCLALGAASFLNKPPKPSELQETIQKLLGQRKQDTDQRERQSDSLLTSSQQDMLTEIINIGVGRAASVLNEMVSSHVRLQIPEVKVLGHKEALRQIAPSNGGDFVSVRLGFNGRLAGNASLVFPANNAINLVKLLVSDDEGDANLNSVQESTLTEIGNIVLNGVMGSIGNCCKETLNYKVPVYVQGSLESAVGFDSSSDSNSPVIVANTVFTVQEHRIEGEMIIFFEVTAFQNLILLLEEQL